MLDTSDTARARESPLVALGAALARTGYRFETVTPATHARVVARPGRHEARDLRDVFGWSLPFPARLVPPELLERMRAARVLAPAPGGLHRSTVRFSSLRTSRGVRLFAHSAYPTDEPDAVFFGPDTVRFAQLLERTARPCARALDLGTGSGAGGVVMAAHAREVVMTDVNPRALEFAAANARLAGVRARFELGDLYAAAPGRFDWIAANPPYLVDAAHRTYRDGGGALGIDLALRIVREGLPRLADGGRLVLYTGVPIVDGKDPLLAELDAPRGVRIDYRELDPDVFGEELDQRAYADVERIAVVALIADRIE